MIKRFKTQIGMEAFWTYKSAVQGRAIELIEEAQENYNDEI